MTFMDWLAVSMVVGGVAWLVFAWAIWRYIRDYLL